VSRKVDQALSGPEGGFTTVAAAHVMGFPVSPDEIARLAQKGVIPAVRVGKQWRLTAAAVQEARRLLEQRARERGSR
jgi:excisionase family DNA binding protein